MKQVNKWILGVALAVMLTATASAADLQKGLDAYKDGDYATAFVIFTISAEAGDRTAQYYLGEMYATGKGVGQDDAEAVKWYRLAAEGYRRAAETGDDAAQYHLGLMYKKGEGVAPNDRLAYMWLNLAAVQGHENAKQSRDKMADVMTSERVAEAQKMTVRCITQDYKGCESEATSQDTAEADLQKGLDAYNAEEYATAFSILTPFAEAGDADAQYMLGKMYYNGKGVDKDDAEAEKWYRLASEQGYAAAQYGLGRMYKSGNGVEKDITEAVKWYILAAEAGNADAQFRLGFMYSLGKQEGVERDNVEAVKWYILAAESGDHADAVQHNLSLVYEKMSRRQIAKAKKMAEEMAKKIAENQQKSQ